MPSLLVEAELVILEESILYSSEITLHRRHRANVWNNVLGPRKENVRLLTFILAASILLIIVATLCNIYILTPYSYRGAVQNDRIYSMPWDQCMLQFFT